MDGTWRCWGSKTLALGFAMAHHYLRVLRSSLLFLCLKLVIWILRLIYFMIEITNLVMQHLLLNVILNMLDSEINHVRHLIKVQFVNKGIDLINLPSLFILKISVIFATVNSEIFARTLFTRNFAYAKFRENKKPRKMAKSLCCLLI